MKYKIGDKVKIDLSIWNGFRWTPSNAIYTITKLEIASSAAGIIAHLDRQITNHTNNRIVTDRLISIREERKNKLKKIQQNG